MNKPYIRLYKTLPDETKVYIVDGSYIRREMNEQFTNFGQHFRFANIIPRDEFWIDTGHGHDEYKYFIDHMLVERDAMAKGRSYPVALIRADKVEKKERVKMQLDKKIWKTIDGVQVYIVNGEAVRYTYNIDFTEGGHDKVYSWIPKNEIWLDSALPNEERDIVLLHEIHERNLMTRGLNYNSAHNSASKIEKKTRKRPSMLNKELSKEYKMLGKIRGIK